MNGKKNLLVIFFLSVLVCVLTAQEKIARFEGGDITREELEKAASFIPWQINQKYIFDDDYSRFAEIYAIGHSLTDEQIDFVLQNEQVARLIQDRKEDMLSRALYTREIVDKIEVSEEELKSYYEDNKDTEFHTPERYKIKHIFISTYKYPPKEYEVEKGDTLESISLKFLDTAHYAPVIKEINNLAPDVILEPGMTLKIPYTWSGERVPIEDEDIIEVRREWAEYIYSLAIRPGTDFSELAEEYSQTDQKDKGAVIGPIPDPRARKPVLPEIMESLKNMLPGEISPVIRTKHGFEIIKLVEILPEEIQSYEDVKNRIHSRLNRQKQEKLVADYLEELKNAPYVTTHYEVMDQDDIAPDTVILEVGDYTKTYQDLLSSINKNPSLHGILENPQQLEQYLENILIRQAILEQARRDGIDQSPEFLEEYSHFKAIVLADNYLDEKAAHMTDEIEITTENLEKHYEENIHNFRQPARYNVAQISRKIEDSEEETLSILEEVYEKLAAGVPFDQLASEYSTDAYAQKGGKVGFIREDARNIQYMNVVSDLEKNEFSKPFRLNNAYYIIQLLDEQEAVTQPFEEVREQVIRMYRANLRREKQEQLLDNLLEKIDYEHIS